MRRLFLPQHTQKHLPVDELWTFFRSGHGERHRWRVGITALSDVAAARLSLPTRDTPLLLQRKRRRQFGDHTAHPFGLMHLSTGLTHTRFAPRLVKRCHRGCRLYAVINTLCCLISARRAAHTLLEKRQPQAPLPRALRSSKGLSYFLYSQQPPLGTT